MDKNQELSNLKKKILRLNKNFPRKNLVFSDGNKDAKIMIVGEAPGRTEDKLQKPFMGRAGKLLDSLLEKVLLDRSKVYITNVVNYRNKKYLFIRTAERKCKIPQLSNANKGNL